MTRKEKLGREREGGGVFAALQSWVVLRVKGLGTGGGFALPHLLWRSEVDLRADQG